MTLQTVGLSPPRVRHKNYHRHRLHCHWQHTLQTLRYDSFEITVELTSGAGRY